MKITKWFLRAGACVGVVLTLLLALLCAVFVSPRARAADTVQVLPGTVHSVVNGGTNTVPSATTNLYRGSGTIWSLPQGSGRYHIACESVNTNANGLVLNCGPMFMFDGGYTPIQSANWVTNALAVTTAKGVALSQNSTNISVTNITTALPQYLYPYYRLGEIWNTNVSGTNAVSLKVTILPL